MNTRIASGWLGLAAMATALTLTVTAGAQHETSGGGVTVRFQVTRLHSRGDSPRSRVAVVFETPGAPRQTVALREVTGQCSMLDTDQRGRSLGALRCWWAGQGDQWRVERVGSDLVVSYASLQEETPANAERYRVVRRFRLRGGEPTAISVVGP